MEFLKQITQAGNLIALALIGAFQYWMWTAIGSHLRKRLSASEEKLTELNERLSESEIERKASELESNLLVEIFSEQDAQVGLAAILQKFIPRPDAGFAAYIPIIDRQRVLKHTRGLSASSREAVYLDTDLLRDLNNKGHVVISGEELEQCGWFISLSPTDRDRASQLIFLGVGVPGNYQGVLATTGLAPAEAPLDRQLTLAKKVLKVWSFKSQQGIVHEAKEQELRAKQDQLDLITILDQPSESPLELLQQFLECLAKKAQVDRAVLFISESSTSPPSSRVQAGKQLQSNIRLSWSKHEQVLALYTLGMHQSQFFDKENLNEMQITSLIGSAATVPLKSDQGTKGVIVLTRASALPFEEEERDLASWAGKYITTELHRALANHHAAQEARTDALTGLANRRAFDRRLQQEMQIAYSTSSECSLLMIDLDKFKSINDKYGHPAGDQVIRSVAAILKDSLMNLRQGDRSFAARYGGEEMSAILPGIPSSGAVRIADMIRARLENTPVELPTGPLKVTMSVGVATYPSVGPSTEEILSAADAALYAAKQGGRNQVCVYSPQLAPAHA